MKLRTLSVNQFKRFIEPTKLGELRDGLNVVIGPNELGKSTLLDALRAVLFERYSSKARPITALQNDRSNAAPVVELSFELDGGEYILTKRFVKNAYAQLRCPDGTLLQADAAEDQLRDLLGFTEAGVRGATSETLGMWGVLWVQQGQSFGKPDLPDTALASLSAGLESEVGAVLGGRRGRELPQIIEQMLGELITEARRQPRGQYKAVLDHIEDQNERLSEQQQLQRKMAETLEQLVMAETRLTRLDSDTQDRIDREELEQARVRLGEVMRSEAELEAARSELQNRQGQLDNARRAQCERADRRSELADAREQLRQERKRLEELQRQERESTAPLEELRQTVNEAEAAVEMAEESEARCRLILDLVSRSTELSDLLRRQSDVATVQRRLDETQSKADQIQVTDESLQRIREATQALDQAKAQLTVATTRIDFDIPSDRLLGIEVDGSQLDDPPGVIEAVEKTVITIPERGRITVDPPIADRDQLLRGERAAQTDLRKALNEAGAQSLAEAEILRDRRRDHEADSNAARAALERLLPTGGASTLQNRIEELRQSQPSMPSEWHTPELPERDHAEAELRKAQSDLQKARERQRVARAAVEERGSAITALSNEVLKAQSSENFQADLVRRRQEKLESDADAAPDDQIAAAVARLRKLWPSNRSLSPDVRPIGRRAQGRNSKPEFPDWTQPSDSGRIHEQT